MQTRPALAEGAFGGTAPCVPDGALKAVSHALSKVRREFDTHDAYSDMSHDDWARNFPIDERRTTVTVNVLTLTGEDTAYAGVVIGPYKHVPPALPVSVRHLHIPVFRDANTAYSGHGVLATRAGSFPQPLRVFSLFGAALDDLPAVYDVTNSQDEPDVYCEGARRTSWLSDDMTAPMREPGTDMHYDAAYATSLFATARLTS